MDAELLGKVIYRIRRKRSDVKLFNFSFGVFQKCIYILYVIKNFDGLEKGFTTTDNIVVK